jgi:hypothetical protein
MNLMICLRGEPEQLPFLPEIAELGAGIELGSYGLVGIQSERDWDTRFSLHQALRAQFQGPIALHGPFIGIEYNHIDHLIRAAVNRRLDKEVEDHVFEVQRLTVEHAPAGAPTTVLLKRVPGSGTGASNPEPPANWLPDVWASLEFMREIFGEANPLPRLYAGDRQAGWLLIGFGMPSAAMEEIERVPSASVGQTRRMNYHSFPPLYPGLMRENHCFGSRTDFSVLCQWCFIHFQQEKRNGEQSHK